MPRTAAVAGRAAVADSIPAAASSGAVLWPMAVHSAVSQTVSCSAELASAVGSTAGALDTDAARAAATSTQRAVFTAPGLARAKFVMSRTSAGGGGAAVRLHAPARNPLRPMSRCLILRPVQSAAAAAGVAARITTISSSGCGVNTLCGPATSWTPSPSPPPALMGKSARVAPGSVHASMRNIVAPSRLVSLPTFRVTAHAVLSGAAAVARSAAAHQPPPAAASAAAAAAPAAAETAVGGASPLSCIQTLVANAAAATQLAARNDATTTMTPPDSSDQNESTTDTQNHTSGSAAAAGAPADSVQHDAGPFKQPSGGSARKRLSSTTDDLRNKLARQS